MQHAKDRAHAIYSCTHCRERFNIHDLEWVSIPGKESFENYLLLCCDICRVIVRLEGDA